MMIAKVKLTRELEGESVSSLEFQRRKSRLQDVVEAQIDVDRHSHHRRHPAVFHGLVATD